MRSSVPCCRYAFRCALNACKHTWTSDVWVAFLSFFLALQVIVEKYRIPPDIAGVTFLSFGNGSPDVFSNIAAFSLSSPNIGVTSILGGGLLVTTGIRCTP